MQNYIYLQYGLALANATVTNSYSFSGIGEVGWSTTYPTWQSGYQIWIRQVTEKEGLPNEYGTPYLDTAVNQLNTRIGSSETNITALQTKLKRIWINENTDGDYVAGTYAASGINGITFVESNPQTYGYNTLLRHNALDLRYNTVKMTSLTTAALTFYIPTQSNNQWTQGNKGLELTAEGLKLFQFQSASTDNPTIAAELNSGGLTLSKGGISVGSYNASATDDNQNFVYISSADYGSVISTLHNTKTDWRALIGNKFGVDKAGNLYASNANISGTINANHGSITGDVTIGGNTTIDSGVQIGGRAQSEYLNDNLEIGGRNYCAELVSVKSNSGNGLTFTDNGDGVWTLIGTSTGSGGNALYYIINHFTALGYGDAFTLSLDDTYDSMPDDMRFYVNFANSSSTTAQKTLYGDYGANSLTFTCDSDLRIRYIGLNYKSGSTFNATVRMKLEKGNKATDWTPAPEDVQAEIDAKKNVHTLLSAITAGNPYATLLGWAKEGVSNNYTINTTSTPITNVKIGDSVRLGFPVSNMGAEGNRPLVYINGTVTAIPDATHVTLTAHGLDTTIIDGGDIITNSVGANQIAANSIGAKHLTISDSTNLATANEQYESSLPTNLSNSYRPAINSGYLVKETATQEYLMVCDYTPNNFKQDDELYYEFYGKAATAGTIYIVAYGYTGTGGTYTYSHANSTSISLTTSEAFYSGTIKLANSAWNTATSYLLAFSDSRSTKSQIYVRKVIIRRKNGGELVVDGSITTDKLAANTITIGKIASDTQSQILNSEIEVGGRNILKNSGDDIIKLWGTAASNGGTMTKTTDQTVSEWGASDAIRVTGQAGSTNALFGLINTIYANTDLSISGQPYVFSVYIKNNASTNLTIGFNGLGSSVVVPANTITRVISTNAKGTGSGNVQFTVSAAAASGSYDFIYWHPQIEYGTKATDWSPAPEDVQSEIDAKKSIHTLTTNNTAGRTYAAILALAAEGAENTFEVNESTTGIKVGDTVRIKYLANDMGTGGTWVYIIGTVRTQPSTNAVAITAHGLDTTVIDGGHILTGTIDAARIAANSITANKLQMADYNNYVTVTENDESSLLPNGGITITDGWCYKTSATGSNVGVSAIKANWTKTGEKYRVTGIAKVPVAGRIRIYFNGRNANESWVAGNYCETVLAADTETTISEVITITSAVADCAKCNLAVYFYSGSSGSTYQVGYFKQLRVERMSGAELIVDGEITADKLAANSVTADKIAANAVTADKIAANAITIGQIATDTQSQILNSEVEIDARNYWRAIDSSKRTIGVSCVTYTYDGEGTYVLTCTNASTTAFAQIYTSQWIDATDLAGKTVIFHADSITTTNSSADERVYLAMRNASGVALTGQVLSSSNLSKVITLPASLAEIQLIIRMDQNKAHAVGDVMTVVKPKLEIGHQATGWTQAPEDVKLDIVDSAKTATTYISVIDENGIRVHAANNPTSNYAKINADGMEVYKGGTSVAQFGEEVRLGTSDRLELSENKIMMVSGNSTPFMVENPENGTSVTRTMNVTTNEYGDFFYLPSSITEVKILAGTTGNPSGTMVTMTIPKVTTADTSYTKSTTVTNNGVEFVLTNHNMFPSWGTGAYTITITRTASSTRYAKVTYTYVESGVQVTVNDAKLNVASSKTTIFDLLVGKTKSYSLITYGHVAVLNMQIQTTATTAAGANVYEGMLYSMKPVGGCRLSGYYGGVPVLGGITDTGDIVIRNCGSSSLSVTGNNFISVGGTFIFDDTSW